MELARDYEVGDRVRLTCPYAGAHVGEEAKVVRVKRDGQGNVLSLDILLDERSEATRGTTVYPREIELVRR